MGNNQGRRVTYRDVIAGGSPLGGDDIQDGEITTEAYFDAPTPENTSDDPTASPDDQTPDDVTIGPVRDAETGEIIHPASKTGSGEGQGLGADNFEDAPETIQDQRTNKENIVEQQQYLRNQEKTVDRDSTNQNTTSLTSTNAVLQNFQRTTQNRSDVIEIPNNPEKVDAAQGFVRQNPLVGQFNTPPNTQQALQTREANLETKQNIKENIDAVKSADPGTTFLIDGEEKSRAKVLTDLQQEEQQVEKTMAANENTFSRAQNPLTLSPDAQEDVRNLIETDGRTTQTVEEEARNINLDNLKANADIPFTGDIGEFQLSGLPARAAASFDTFTSDQGFEQLSTIAPFVEKEGAQVIKENIVESRRDRTQDAGFDPVDEGLETLSSPIGLTAGAGAAGGGFKLGTSALAARGGRAATAAKGLEVGAAGAGAAYTGLELEESKQKFQEGDDLGATENILRLGSETVGFAGGTRAASKALKPKIDGPVRITELSNVKQTGQNEFVGSGEFRGETNIRQGRLAEFLGIGESGKANLKGRFNVRGGEGTSEARGSLEVELPSGRTRTRDFESLSIDKSETETPSRQEVTLSSDLFRTFNEGPLFRSTSTRSGRTKSIKEEETPLSETVAQQGNLIVRNKDVDGRIIERASFSRGEDGQEIFGDSKIIVTRETSGQGSAGSGSGSGQTFEGGSGRVVGSNSQAEIISSDLAGKEFVDLAARPPRPGGSRTALGLGSGGSGAQGSQAGLQENLNQEFEGQQDVDLEQAQEADSLQIQRPQTTQEVVDSFAPSGQAQEFQDVGGPSLEETQRDPVQEVNPFEPDLDEGVDQRTDPIQEQKPGQDVVPKEVQDQAPVEELRPVEEVAPVQEEKILQDQELLTEQIQKTAQVRAEPLGAKPSRIGPRAGIPFLTANLPEPSQENSREITFFEDTETEEQPKAAPSVDAILFGETTEDLEDETVFTGFETRPVPDDFDLI